jgi:hypothetical protein
VAGMPNSRSLAPLLSHATARPGRLAPRYRARPGQYKPRSAGGSGASPSDLTNATAQPQRPQKQLGGVWKIAKSIKALSSKATRQATTDELLNEIGE